MENELPTAMFRHTASQELSLNGWTNQTAQSIEIDITDTGGSLFASYELQKLTATDNWEFGSL